LLLIDDFVECPGFVHILLTSIISMWIVSLYKVSFPMAREKCELFMFVFPSRFEYISDEFFRYMKRIVKDNPLFYIKISKIGEFLHEKNVSAEQCEKKK
jgi:hypothetical protein